MAMNNRTAYLEWIYKDVDVEPDGKGSKETETYYIVPMSQVSAILSSPCIQSYNGKTEEGMIVSIRLMSGEMIVMRILKTDWEDIRRIFLSNRTEYLGVIRSLKHLLCFGGDAIEF